MSRSTCTWDGRCGYDGSGMGVFHLASGSSPNAADLSWVFIPWRVMYSNPEEQIVEMARCLQSGGIDCYIDGGSLCILSNLEAGLPIVSFRITVNNAGRGFPWHWNVALWQRAEAGRRSVCIPPKFDTQIETASWSVGNRRAVRVGLALNAERVEDVSPLSPLRAPIHSRDLPMPRSAESVTADLLRPQRNLSRRIRSTVALGRRTGVLRSRGEKRRQLLVSQATTIRVIKKKKKKKKRVSP